MRETTRSAARLLIATLCSVVVAGPALGMGGFGGTRESGAPVREYRGVLTDVDGHRMELTRVTVGGDTTLEGELGRGRLRIPFDNVARVRFEPSDGGRDRVRADVTLREGEPVSILVRSSTTIYGQTPGGAYQIRARDLRSLELAAH
ncbi:MAG TPA: hypothetical protein VFD84_05160 [Candidatus Binatia bacterium]|jgi:hypothetical protein|nr:hypothetical protein [Candidatus Binatia bacterium]